MADPDWIDDNPYAFHMFENDNANRALFNKEVELVHRLRSLRQSLTKHKRKLKSSLANFQG